MKRPQQRGWQLIHSPCIILTICYVAWSTLLFISMPQFLHLKNEDGNTDGNVHSNGW